MTLIADYTEKSDILDDLTNKNSLLNISPISQQEFTDNLEFDASNEGVYSAQIPLGAIEFISSTAYTVASSNTLYTKPRNANFAIVTWAQASAAYDCGGVIFLARVGAISEVVRVDGPNANDNYAYTFAWEVTGIRITETADPGANSSITGTIYWYQ